MSAIMMVHNNNIKSVSVAATPVLTLSYVLNNSSSWPGSGTTITDLSGNGYNGTLVNSPTYTSTSITTATGGFSPKCISTSYNLPNRNWSVRVIANVSSTQTYWATIWGNDSYSANQGFFAYSSSLNNMFVGATGAGGGVSYFGTFQGTTRQFDYTYDGTNYKIYYNGNLMATSTTYSPPTVATNGLYFGSRHQNSGGATFTDGCNATFYLMQVYTGAVLSASQILTDYTNNKVTYGI